MPRLTPTGQRLADLGRVRVLDLLEDGQRGLGIGDGPGAVAELVEGQGHVPEVSSLAAPVPYLTCDLQLLLVVLDGAAWLP